MNRDATVVQVAILLIIIAVIGVAIVQQQNKAKITSVQQDDVFAVQESEEGEEDNNTTTTGDTLTGSQVVVPEPTKPSELTDSDNANLVKQYFAYIANKQYLEACSLVAGGKCSPLVPATTQQFAREFEKMQNGYEYVAVKDYGFVAPSGKEVVCVKYSYRYANDPNPGLVSEVMTFYLQPFNGEMKIANRVCEKKYKEGRGVRSCPIQASVEFCEGLIK